MDAVTAFFTGQQPAACAPTQNLFFPTPVAPTRLARVSGRSRAIKTVNAVAETLDDVRRHFIGDAVAAGHTPRSGSRVGGLRSGYARFTDSGIQLRHTAYVPRVAVTGLYRLGDESSTTVRVSGAGAPHGTLTFHADGRVTGRLGGKKVRLKASAARVRTPRKWPLRLPPFPALRRG
jgi:hypothetical protein